MSAEHTDLGSTPAAAASQQDAALRHRVLIAGLGNLGSPAAFTLAQTPQLGFLRLVDRDRVERKNLTNQWYDDPAMVGQYKVDVIAERIRAAHPHLTVETRAADLEDLALGDFDDVDVCVGALDSLRARQVLVSERAWPLGKTVIDGGVGDPLLGRVHVFLPGPETACLECPWGQLHYRQLAAEYPCRPGASAAGPATGAPGYLGAAVAGLMVAKAIRALQGQLPLESNELFFDLDSDRFLVARLRRACGCRFNHKVVSERVTLDFASATVTDMLDAAATRYGHTTVQFQFRRGVSLDSDQRMGAARFIPAERLRPLAAERLSRLGLTPRDYIRMSDGQGDDCWVTFSTSSHAAGDLP